MLQIKPQLRVVWTFSAASYLLFCLCGVRLYLNVTSDSKRLDRRSTEEGENNEAKRGKE